MGECVSSCCSEWPQRRKMPRGSRLRMCWRKACPPFPPPQLHPVKFAASSRACRSLQSCHCSCSVTKSCPTLYDPTEPTRLLCPWDSPGKNTEVGCHFLLQGIFLMQGSNHVSCIGRQVLYHWTTWEAPFSKVCLLLMLHSADFDLQIGRSKMALIGATYISSTER